STSNTVTHVVNQPACPINVTGVDSATTYATIQEAINALPNPGPCTVNVLAGTYNEAVTISSANSTATLESQRIFIQRDSSAAVGSVFIVNPGAASAVTFGGAKFITFKGFDVSTNNVN